MTDVPSNQTTEAAAAAATPATTSPKRGSSVGRYVILGLVGSGAMGEVYAAYDPELDRKIALKLLHADGNGDTTRSPASESKARLLREAQAIARLSHPNVIVVHDAGSFEDRVFVAMEFVDGNTLGYWLQATQRAWKEVLKVFVLAGRGLESAHRAGLVHRDFKMENVMIARDGNVRVMDFGLARRVSNAVEERPGHHDGGRPTAIRLLPGLAISGSEDLDATVRIPPSNSPSNSPSQPPSKYAPPSPPLSQSPSISPSKSHAHSPSHSDRPDVVISLTHTGALMGTPAYMSPEQFLGQVADERSDQFSFCVALYEGLYGARPFVGKSFRALAAAVTRGQIPPPPESTRVPSWVRKVVLRGLRKNPAERWPSMAALLAALERDPRVRWLQGAAVAAALVASIGVGVGIRQQARNAYQPTCQVAGDRFRGVWEPASALDGRRRQIQSAFQATRKAYAPASFTAMAALMDRYVQGWTAMYGDACEATYVRGEQSAELLDLRMTCLHDRWNEVDALSNLFAHPDADSVANAVKAASSLTPLDRCADVRSLKATVPLPRDPEVRRRVEALSPQVAVVKAMFDAGQYARALAAAAQLLSSARATTYAPLLAESLYRLAVIQMAFRRSGEAERNLDEAIWLAEASRRDDIVATASIEQIYNAGYLQKDVARARRWKRQAEAFLDRMGGHELERAWMANNFGVALEMHGEMEDAVESYRTSLRIKEKILGPHDPDIASSLINLADGLTSLGRYGEALTLSNRGLSILTGTLGWEHGDTALQLGNRAELLNRMGRYSEASADAERACQTWEREFGPSYPNLAFGYQLLGEASLGLERPAEAIPFLERALEIATKHGDESRLRVLRLGLARALWDSGRAPHRARELARVAARLPHESSGPDASPAPDSDRHIAKQATDWLAAHDRSVPVLTRSPLGVGRSGRRLP